MSYSRGPRGGMNRGDAQRVSATVKWFNRTKGFGFITASDGSGDVFLPASVLAGAGYDEVGEGTTIVCDVVDGPKGRSVSAVIDVDASSAVPPRGGFDRGPRQDRGGYGQGGYGQDRGGYGQGGYGQDRGGYSQGGYEQRGGGYGQDRGGYDRAPSGPTEQLDGVVKWFDVVRGFGFISPSDGGKDVFVHVSALRRSGLETLTTGQNVRMEVQEARRGREAASVEVI